MKKITLLAIIILMSLSLGASGKKKFWFQVGTEENISSEGIKIRVMRDAKAIPITPLTTYPLTYSSSTGTKKIDAFSPFELWMHEQYIAKWEGDNCTMLLCRMSKPPPAGMKLILGKFILREAYDKWNEKEGNNKVGDEDIVPWLEFFLSSKVAPSPETVKSSPSIKILKYKLNENSKEYKEIYVACDPKKPDAKYAVLYQLDKYVDVKKSSTAILQSINSMSFFSFRETDNKQLTSKASRKKKEWTDEYIASRENVINNIKNLKDWWFLETDNYIIVSNLKSKKLIGDIEKNIEQCRKVFQSFYPIKKPLKEVSVLKVFRDRDEYLAYLGRNSDLLWSIGFWAAHKKELAVSPLDNLKGQDLNKMILSVLYHEGFHQYMYYASDKSQISMWFDEGNATFFEGIKFKGKDNFDMEITKRCDSMDKLVQRNRINIPALIRMGREEFYSEKGRSDNYTLAWGLMYFLYKGTPVLKNKNSYSEIPMKYYDALLATGNPVKATQTAWEGIDMNKFKEDFLSFWNSDNYLAKSKNYDPLDEKNRKKQ